MQINKDLIWDYSLTEEDLESEPFREWYLARVLMRGGMKDIKQVGLKTIHDYFPRLILPENIREFWTWFFKLPDTERLYGYLDTSSKRFHT